MFKILLLGLLMATQINANKLINEDSPYLQQHAHNPVEWYPWGDEAFQKAKKENKLIFLSIGYSTCHWCHVMERESFENEEVAEILNKDFISIKVDREEYPHIDRHYQDIYALMNQRGGGWPLTIVMTPNKKVFFSATYLPAENSFGRGGLKSTLKMLYSVYTNKKDEVLKSADSIEAAMKQRGSANHNQKVSLDIEIADKFVNNISSGFDLKNKGIGSAPKFPHATSLDTLLDVYRITGNESAKLMATDSLKAMSNGGIYDQIEGGFYRYSVDEMWMIPHFEKMLYTNAELIEAYANAYAITHEERFKTVIKETIQNINERFLKEDMYFSASDADSDGEEGKYFVFDYKQSLEDLIKSGFSNSDAKEVLNYFSIYKGGNFEHGKTNPYLGGMDKPKELEKAKKILRANREKKNYAFIDHKIQTSWNAMYIKSLFKSAKYVDNSFSKQALKSIDSILKNLYINGELYHQMIVGKKPKVKGYLEDYSFLISALIEAYQVNFDEKYLKIAKELSDTSVMKFYKNGVWYMSDDEFEAKAEFYDASYRSAKAVMIENLFKIAILTDNLKLHGFANESLESNLAVLKSLPEQYPYGLKTYLQSLLSNVLIKSTKENLLKNRALFKNIKYPYVLLKPSADKNFLACKIDRCFAIDKDVSVIIDKIEKVMN
jgi:uncharacterized protein YyaL (SSP411 family)